VGFCVDRPARKQWQGAVETARKVLSCPPVPAGWFEREPRAVAEAVVELDRHSRANWEALAGLPEFGREALRLADAVTLARLAMPADAPRAAPRPGETVKALRQRLAALTNALRELRRLAGAADQAAGKVGDVLGLSLPTRPIEKLGGLVKLADQIARTGPVRRSWWDAGRRKELQGVIARCLEKAQAAQEARAGLAARIAPRAFEPESAAVAARASVFRSWLARLLRVFAWRSLKSQVAGWYAEESPGAGALVADMTLLAGYHRGLDYCRQVRTQYAADLVPGADGEPDWDRTLKALGSVDRLEQLTKIPPKLQAALSAEGGLDRRGLLAAGKALAERVGSLRQGLEAVAREYDLTEVTGGTPGQVRLSAPELVAWLDAQVGAVGRPADLLEYVCGLFAEGADVAAEALPARVLALATLGKHRVQVAALCGKVWTGQAPAKAEERDWSALSAAAGRLLHLLDFFRGQLPPTVVRVLTDPATRGQLADAVHSSDAACADAFAESWQFLGALFDLTRPVSTGLTVEAAPLADPRAWPAERPQDPQRIHEWTLFCEVEREIGRAGVSPILAEVLAGRVKSEQAGEAFRARFPRLWRGAVYAAAPALGHFAGDRHERLIGRFRELGRRAVAAAAARIRAYHLSRDGRTAARRRDPSQQPRSMK
jgi:hypothetical protein